MCGIAGFVARDPVRPFADVVRRMIALQKHRGPDGSGFYESKHAALGHCRLAILDPSPAGQQPMSDGEGRYWIVYNGEIYNYLELARDLRGAGHAFRSRCDTEVLLAAYREWGAACVERLRGMFAFAVWDDHEQRLFAARDRLGVKPFHYWVEPDGERFAFASEIKALVDFLPDCQVNERLAGDYLAWNLLDHDPAETMFRGLWRLPPGHRLVWDRHCGLRLERYWRLEVTEELRSSPAQRDRLIAEFREEFFESVRLHLRSDVPVGSCLSGGLDSSAIVGAMSREIAAAGGDGEQHTFSACFDDPALDERPYIDAVTRATGTRNHRVFPDGRQLAGEIDQWLWHQDEPVGGFGVYSQYCVVRLARDHGVKVLLDGQGADEQLLGYRKFIPAYLRQLLHVGRYVEAAREAGGFLLSRDILRDLSLAEGMRYWKQSVPDGLLLWPDRPAPPRPAGLGVAPPLGRRIDADLTRFSLPVLLRFEDRNSMAFGVESRVPFVDHVLVEWIARLPIDLRLRGGWTKRILRDALDDLLPPLVRQRKSKLGFSTPDWEWLNGPLRPWIMDTLTRPAHLPRLVDPAGVAHVLSLYQRQQASGVTLAMLFRLALFEHWAGMYLGAHVRTAATAPAV